MSALPIIPLGRGLGIRELQAGDRLVELANQLLRHDVMEDGRERGHRFDRELGLTEVAVLPGVFGEAEAAIADRRDGDEGLNEDVLDPKPPELLVELPSDLFLVFRHGRARAPPGRRSPACSPATRVSQSGAWRAWPPARSDRRPRRALQPPEAPTGSALRCAPEPAARARSRGRSARPRGRSESLARGFPR